MLQSNIDTLKCLLQEYLDEHLDVMVQSDINSMAQTLGAIESYRHTKDY